MQQAANTDLINPLGPKVYSSECQIILFPLQIKPEKVNLKLIGGFERNYFVCILGTNGLMGLAVPQTPKCPNL